MFIDGVFVEFWFTK